MMFREGDLSGLSQDQLRGWLVELRRIAGLPDPEALTALDTMAWGISEAIAAASGRTPDVGDWLGRSHEEGAARFRADLERARAGLQHPSSIGAFDGLHLRQAASLYAENEADRQEALALADALEAGYYTAVIERALTEPISSTASLPKNFRMVGVALVELQKRGRLTPALEQRAREARERLARFRAQKKCDEAEVADAGGNLGKADRLRREASALLAQDWPRVFPGESVPLEAFHEQRRG